MEEVLSGIFSTLQEDKVAPEKRHYQSTANDKIQKFFDVVFGEDGGTANIRLKSRERVKNNTNDTKRERGTQEMQTTVKLPTEEELQFPQVKVSETAAHNLPPLPKSQGPQSSESEDRDASQNNLSLQFDINDVTGESEAGLEAKTENGENLEASTQNVDDTNLEIEEDEELGSEMKLDLDAGTDSGLELDASEDVGSDLELDASEGTDSGLELDASEDVGSNLELDTSEGTDSGLELDTSEGTDSGLELDASEGTDSGLELDTSEEAGSDLELDTSEEMDSDLEFDASEETNPDLELDTSEGTGADLELGASGETGPDLELGAGEEEVSELNLNSDEEVNSELDLSSEEEVEPELDLGQNEEAVSELTFDSEEKTDTEAEPNLEGETASELEFGSEEENVSKPQQEKVVPYERDLPSEKAPPSFYEGEALRFQATIGQLRKERDKLLAQIREVETGIRLIEQDNLGLRSELDESKIEISILKKRHEEEVSELKYKLRFSDDKRMISEEKSSKLQKEFDRLQQKVRIDFEQVTKREKTLESQLELVQMDSDVQLKTRNQKILELKRKIDQLEFSMENAWIKEQKSKDDKLRLQEGLERLVKTLKVSMESLEEDFGPEIKEHLRQVK